MSAYSPEWPSPLFVRGYDHSPGNPTHALAEILHALQLGTVSGLTLTARQCEDMHLLLSDNLGTDGESVTCADCGCTEDLYCEDCAIQHVQTSTDWI